MKVVYFIVLLSLASCMQYDWSQVQDVVNKYHQSGAFPGGVLFVANQSNTLYQLAFGHFSHNQIPFSSPSFQKDTIFDIASLSKVTATLSVIMSLCSNEKLDVKDKVSKYIPQYANNGKQSTLIENLLLHNAGLLPDYPGKLPQTKLEVMKWVYACKLQSPIGTKFVYSDLSFILLAQIAERITGIPVNNASGSLFRRMGMNTTGYLPLGGNNDLDQLIYKIAPTEYSVFRKKLIRGEVHDPTAYLFKGVAGHAGVFSIAADLVKYMQIHLRKGLDDHGQIVFKQKIVQKFYTRVDGLPYNNRRALGWDTVPIQDNPPCGHLFSPNSFGHTGYTGTMAWADRDKGLIIVFLTNRVHPTSLNVGILQARANIADTIVKVWKSGQNLDSQKKN